jgi:cell wall-associated NlpC family hydrolase
MARSIGLRIRMAWSRITPLVRAFIGLLAIAATIPSRGDTDISIDMTIPAAERADRDQASQPPCRQGPPENSPTTSTPSRRLASRGSATRSRGVAIGRLARAVVSTTVRVDHTVESGSITTIAEGTYLALTEEADGWYGVLMADETTGWIERSNVEVLDYEVVADGDRRSPAQSVRTSAANGMPLATAQRSIIQVAYTYLGIPYRFGGQSSHGIDCSAFVQCCFRSVGVRLPRTAAEQARHGMPVPCSQLQAADRLYFASRDGRITHTGIYIGNGYFIHASSSRHKVAISRLSEGLYARMYACARR